MQDKAPKEKYEAKENKLLESIQEMLYQRAGALGKKIQQRGESIQRNLNKPQHLETSTKAAFMVGVMLTITTCLIVGRVPQYLPIWYLLWSFILLSSRFFMYHKMHEHYFMIDFCYFSNFSLLFYLFLYPTSPDLFVLNLANSAGPLLWAIVAWRNSLVFHDMDKITSVFIHVFPVIVTYVIRWFPEMTHFAICPNEQCTVSIAQVILPHLAFFMFWQVSYYIKTEVIDKKLMEKRQELVTSFRYLTKDEKSKFFKIVNIFGPNYRVLLFMAVQALYHVLTVLPVVLMFYYQWIHTLFISCMFESMIFTILDAIGVCVWNGANIYISARFYKMYLSRLESIKKALESNTANENE